MHTEHPSDQRASAAAGLLSISVIKIAPGNILFVGDSKGGAVFAFELGPATAAAGSQPFNLRSIDRRIAALLGVTLDEITIRDLAIHPITKEAYVAVERGHAAQAIPVIIRASQDGTMAPLPLDSLPFTKLALSQLPNPGLVLQNGAVARNLSITDLELFEGELLISGLSTAEFSSTLYRARYPFSDQIATSTIEIYHAVHSQNETRAPIQTMTVLPLNGQPHVLAAYTCTPLVTIPLAELKDGAHVKGKTIGELGYGNAPAEVLSFQSQNMQGQTHQHVLLINRHRGPMLFSLDTLAESSAKEGLHEPVGFNVVAPAHTEVPMGGVIHVDDQDGQYLSTLRRNAKTGSVDLLSFRKGVFFRLSDHVSEFILPGYVYSEAASGVKQFQELLWSDELPNK